MYIARGRLPPLFRYVAFSHLHPICLKRRVKSGWSYEGPWEQRHKSCVRPVYCAGRLRIVDQAAYVVQHSAFTGSLFGTRSTVGAAREGKPFWRKKYS